MSPPLLSVVIPVYNERGTIEEVLRRVRAVGIASEIIVVDDGSTDGTQEALRRLCEHASRDHTRILFQATNRGKGASVRWAFQEARGRIVLIQDADLEYDPADYPRLLQPILNGDADVVFGSRLRQPGYSGSIGQVLGNRVLTSLSNLLTGLRLTDVYVGYKVFRREVLAQIRLREDRFGFEAEVTAKVARGGWRVREVPVSYRPRTCAEGKKIRLRDALWGLWCIVRYRLAD
ncbi:MAG: glycosyltransferase family 2 protein [Armatimonadota bacterium]|nr:glycosyltransferase family 2 protein [Armatimonadota bacterium]